MQKPIVGIVMGSMSDFDCVVETTKLLEKLQEHLKNLWLYYFL